MKNFFLLGFIWVFLVFPSSGAATMPNCDVSDFKQEGSDLHLFDRDIVLLGEVHGNTETPAIVSEIVCRAATSGRRIVLALEAPEDVTADVFSKEKRMRIPSDVVTLSRQYWLRPAAEADGRSSQGLKKLILFLQKLNGLDGFFVDIVTVDISYNNFDQSHMRDLVMAENIKSLQKSGSYDQIFFLGGHYHTRLASNNVEQSDPDTIAHHLEADSFSSVLIYPRGGETWACMGPRGKISCNAHTLPARPSITNGRYNSLVKMESEKSIGYDGLIELPAVTASYPIQGF
jgi:hypothetical protein